MGTVEVTATAMAAGGDALAREPSGRVVFVEGALPGERVLVEITQERKDFARAHVVEVLDPSPHRVAAPCPAVALGCGGCQWQHARPSAQADFKRAVVADALRRIARLDDPPLVAGVRAASATRTTLRAGVDRDGRAGFRRRHGHELVSVVSCLVAHPRLEDLLRDGRFHGADEVLLRVSVATGDRLVVADPTADGVLGLPGDVEVVGLDEVERGEPAYIHEDVADRRWRVSALSFFQPGPDAAALLVDAVRGAAGDAVGTVVDAYAGVGLLGGSLAPDRLIAVESSGWAAADAQVNLADLDTVVVEGEVARVLPGVDEPVDVVVADPARPGLGRGAAAAVAGVGAARIVLVSCDPASLARDIGLLRDAGYGLVSAEVLDLFPQTFHVEVVSVFDRL